MTGLGQRIRRGWSRSDSLGRLVIIVVGSALLTVAAMGARLDTASGVLAFVHLGGLVGAPLGLVLLRKLRSVPVAVAISIALSAAMTALAAQLLLLFGFTERPLLIATATAYGLIVSVLVSDSSRPFRPAPG
ncbi:MAG: hypothetical protein GY724_02485 [Actinomycetia bacterium]|nr:hypothetical protein [Actinomycetes bacterium]MCP5035183.1 hypothetical protein [Actinomycetes bacterium]